MSKRSKALRYYRTYRPEGPFKKTLNFLLRLVLGVFILYLVFSSLALQSYTADLPDMENARFLATPLLYGPEVRLFGYRFPSLSSPGRGELVLAEQGRTPDLPWYALVVNSVTRFFTLNHFTVFSDESQYFGTRFQLVRVIGLPGDRVRLDDFRVRIKAGGRDMFLDEADVLQKEYVIGIPSQGLFTDSSLPFSGDQPELSLGEDEYLLLRDDRSGAAADRGWRITKKEQIMSRVLFAFWPKLKFF